MSSEAELSDLIRHFKSIKFIYINYTQLNQQGGNVVSNILIRFFQTNKNTKVKTKSCNILQGKKRYVSKPFKICA